LKSFEIFSTARSKMVAFDTFSRSSPHTSHLSGGTSHGINASLSGEIVFFHPHDEQV